MRLFFNLFIHYFAFFASNFLFFCGKFPFILKGIIGSLRRQCYAFFRTSLRILWTTHSLVVLDMCGGGCTTLSGIQNEFRFEFEFWDNQLNECYWDYSGISNDYHLKDFQNVFGFRFEFKPTNDRQTFRWYFLNNLQVNHANWWNDFKYDFIHSFNCKTNGNSCCYTQTGNGISQMSVSSVWFNVK